MTSYFLYNLRIQHCQTKLHSTHVVILDIDTNKQGNNHIQDKKKEQYRKTLQQATIDKSILAVIHLFVFLSKFVPLKCNRSSPAIFVVQEMLL